MLCEIYPVFMELFLYFTGLLTVKSFITPDCQVQSKSELLHRGCTWIMNPWVSTHDPSLSIEDIKVLLFNHHTLAIKKLTNLVLRGPHEIIILNYSKVLGHAKLFLGNAKQRNNFAWPYYLKNLCCVISCCEMPTVLISLGSARTPQKRMRVNEVLNAACIGPLLFIDSVA